MLDHPMVTHFWEEHGGREQEVLMRVLSRHLKALERQVIESVLIEKLAGNDKECLNLKSEWAGSKIPGLKVSNPRGLSCNKEGGEEEDQDNVLAQEIFREAVRRGSKRLKYNEENNEDNEDRYGEEEVIHHIDEDKNLEDRVSPWVKRRRVSGRIGEGWDKISPEKEAGLKANGKSPEGRMKEGDRLMGTGGGKVKTFKDLVRRQESITKFVVAVERSVGESKENQDRSPLSTPVSVSVLSRIKRFERKEDSPRLSRTSRSIKKPKPGTKVQNIKKFFMSSKSPETKPSVDKKTLENKTLENRIKRPLWPGTHSKPRVASTSRPPEEPSPQVGGKGGRVRRKVSTGPSRSLEGWLRTGSFTGGLSSRSSEGWSKEGGLEPREEQEDRQDSEDQ